MRIQSLLGKRTWLGLLAAVVSILVTTAVAALLITKGLIREDQVSLCVCICYAVSVLAGSFVAAFRRDSTLLRTMMVAVLLLALAWLTSLVSDGQVTFDKNALIISLTVLGTGVLAGLLYAPTGKRKRKNRKPQSRRR